MDQKETIEATGTEKRVCDDIARRQKLGLDKYRVTVEDNPLELKEWLQHAYEETLDKAIYLKRAIEEMKDMEQPENNTEEALASNDLLCKDRLLAMSEYYDKLQTEWEESAERNGDCEFRKGFAHACKIFKKRLKCEAEYLA